MAWYVGVDVGGTFTDFYAVETDSGRVASHKTPSTPAGPEAAILSGMAALVGAEGIEPAAVRRFAHGTTVATNALIQRRGARVALITTRGFRDLLEIGRQTRPLMYDLKADHPPPLVPRSLRFEIDERIGPKGEIVTPLSEEAIAEAVATVRAAGVDACAVCLLFGFLNDAHERRIGEALLAAMPDLYVSLSSDVQPEFREYERFSTTVLNAYLQPVVARYMDRLADGLSEHAPEAAIGINQSSGGLMSVGRASRYPIRTALSGPAAGAVGAAFVAAAAGRGDVITLDMGGTSADVCLIRDGATEIGREQEVAGFPIRLPMVDIHTVGAGGGSIAWFDRDGLLKVGPASAGADPGPACYGLGGTEPTVTDANLLLGRLSAEGGLLGGAMHLDAAAAAEAMRPFAERLGYDAPRVAQGILGIAAATMVRAIRRITVERGHDPRDFALMAFGGAGPLHARDVARALGIRIIIVPPAPGILCAQGLIVSDLKEELVTSARTPLDADGLATAAGHVRALEEQALDWFDREGIAAEDRTLRLTLEMRYVGQNFELPVLVEGDGTAPVIPDADRLHALFLAAHERSYGFANPDDPVEIMNFRLTALGRLPRPEPAVPAKATSPARPAGRRDVRFEGEAAVAAAVYRRADLAAGHRIEGPAVVEQLDTTTLVYPGDTAVVDHALNLIVEVAA